LLLILFLVAPLEFIGVVFTAEKVFSAVDNSLINCKYAFFTGNLHVA